MAGFLTGVALFAGSGCFLINGLAAVLLAVVFLSGTLVEVVEFEFVLVLLSVVEVVALEKFILGRVTGSELSEEDEPEFFSFVLDWPRCVKGASDEIEEAMRGHGSSLEEATGGSISFIKFSRRSSSWSSWFCCIRFWGLRCVGSF